MALVPKLLLLCTGVVLLHAQWSEPIRIVSLTTEADEIAPSWSPVDSSLYFVRVSSGTFSILRCRLSVIDQLFNADTLHLDAVRDSIIYASFNGQRWVGHRLVLGERQRYAELVFSAEPTRNTSSIVPLRELSHPAAFTLFPALSSNGQIVVFATTQGNSELTTDLWFSKWHGDHWSAPYPLDGFQQSAANEVTPCFWGNDTLLFASDGFGGKGGFDLFLSVFRAGQWLAPVPLIELNSPFDDRDPCILPNGDLLYSSNRAGSYDLYYARRIKNERSSE